MKDVKFMSATEKKKVLSNWERFLESNCAREKFTKSLYHHLINHCSFSGRVLTPITVKAPHGTGKELGGREIPPSLDFPSTLPFLFEFDSRVL